MEVAVVVWEDRHFDTQVEVFTDSTVAIAWAQWKARESSRSFEVDETLTARMQQAGWLYYGCYSSEGGSLRVERCVVDRVR